MAEQNVGDGENKIKITVKTTKEHKSVYLDEDETISKVPKLNMFHVHVIIFMYLINCEVIFFTMCYKSVQFGECFWNKYFKNRVDTTLPIECIIATFAYHVIRLVLPKLKLTAFSAERRSCGSFWSEAWICLLDICWQDPEGWGHIKATWNKKWCGCALGYQEPACIKHSNIFCTHDITHLCNFLQSL